MIDIDVIGDALPTFDVIPKLILDIKLDVVSDDTDLLTKSGTRDDIEHLAKSGLPGREYRDFEVSSFWKSAPSGEESAELTFYFKATTFVCSLKKAGEFTYQLLSGDKVLHSGEPIKMSKLNKAIKTTGFARKVTLEDRSLVESCDGVRFGFSEQMVLRCKPE